MYKSLHPSYWLTLVSHIRALIISIASNAFITRDIGKYARYFFT